ncbi:intradiol ring-cleavage dioxygenase [Sporobolomyces salmoneus]|uniref:intradiol ring-cleavage dioxygenase n=1 Tax=Sporobolomyces salmoneus TaxID=183962 RepID=UPI0031801FDA
MKVSSSLFVAAALFSASLAHKHESKTPEQQAVLQSIEEKMFACAPMIEKYQAMRKGASQEYLASGGSAEQQVAFLDGAFETAESKGETLMSCSPLKEEAKMRNHTCVLAPEVTEGPYYHTEGHPIRQNMAEDQLGLLFLMDVGVIDVNTCKPLPDVLVDLWHANTTGHYAGHPEQEAHLKWEGPAHEGPRKGLLSKYPRTNDHETFLRGAWPTNKNGLSQFTSIFPGYYTGRATHVHIRLHTEWGTLKNGTFRSNRMIHTGQIFVPDTVNAQIDKLHPYNINPIAHKWGRTRNWEDSLQIYQDSHANGHNPEFEVLKLGGVIQQGLIGYITIGIDPTVEHDINAPWSPVPANVAKRMQKTEL